MPPVVMAAAAAAVAAAAVVVKEEGVGVAAWWRKRRGWRTIWSVRQGRKRTYRRSERSVGTLLLEER